MSPAGTGAAARTLAELGEFGLIDLVTAGAPTGPAVQLGPGDDAAVWTSGGPVLGSLDVLVEGVHFRRDWSEPRDVGRKSVAVNVADIEAMGGRPVGILVGLSAPGDLPVAWVAEFADGVRTECAAAGVALLGGDITRSRDITISVAVMGEAADGLAPVRRSGARPGDVVALVGRTGWAAAGMAVLSRGFRSPRAVVEAYRVPSVPYGAGLIAARAGATAMIDVSDGLLADLGHVARASGVVLDVDREALVVPEALQAVAAATGADPYTLLLTGGEDHALAATFDATAVPEGWTVIGTVRASEAPGVLVDGSTWDAAGGWDHFRAPAGRR